MIEVDEKNNINNYVKQHLTNYINAIIEIIKNNTNVLFDGDISSLVKEPPLSSMDTIKIKLINLSKKEDIILQTEKMEKLILKYRKNLLIKINLIKELRNNPLIEKVEKFDPQREMELITLSNSEMSQISKVVTKELKKKIKESIEEDIVKNIKQIFKSDEEKDKVEGITKAFSKFLKTTYLKQLMDSISIKLMVKDKTLINGVNEQGERYLFTKANSHIFD